MKTIMQKLVIRIQNPKVIVAVVSGALLILTNTGIVTVDHANHISDALNTVLTVIVGLGVFGNPESHLIAPVLSVPVPVAPVAPVIPVQAVAPVVAPVAPVVAPLPDGQATPVAQPQFYNGTV